MDTSNGTIDTSGFTELSCSQDDGVLTVEIESSSKGNTLNGTLFSELFDLAIRLNEDDGVRCLVLTGTEDIFCSGVDLAELSGRPEDAVTSRRYASLLHDTLVQFHQAETPIIVGVNGVAAGAGFSLAVSGDLVVVSEDAKMEFVYTRIGLTGDGGVTFFLPRLVGLRRAKELVLLDEPIGAEEAVELGLATETVPGSELDDRLASLAADISAGPVNAYGGTLGLLTRSFDRSLEEQLGMETDVIAEAISGKEFAEGYKAFVEKRSPEFK